MLYINQPCLVCQSIGGSNCSDGADLCMAEPILGKTEVQERFFWFKGVKVISCIICTTPGLQNKTKFEFILHDRKTDQHTAAGLGFIS